MATFTLPYELRFLAWDHQTLVYNILFACASSTLKDFGLNPKNLGAGIGMTAVLHTHTRHLDYHSHIHVVVPGGGVDKAKKQWKKKTTTRKVPVMVQQKVKLDRTLCASELYPRENGKTQGVCGAVH
jgi:hypothetical protein